MLENPRFTIGKISISWHSKSTFKTAGNDFEYYLNGKKYEFVTKSLPVGTPIETYYLVLYDSANLNAPSSILLEYPIPDSIPVPINGWSLKEIPIDINWSEIERKIKKNNLPF